jgi:hypothetical protein
MADLNDLEEGAKRAIRLTKLFNAVIHGHRELKTAADGQRFLEAFCAQEDVTKCVECLIAAPGGLPAVAKSFRYSGDSAFLNGRATSVLHYLSHPSLKQLYNGDFLHRVLEEIVEPPTFWKTLYESHYAETLTEEATHAFAWLLYELLCCTHEEGHSDVWDVAEKVTKDRSLLKSPALDVPNLGYKIQHVTERTTATDEEHPGGRHDNDFVDYHRIRLLPTPDEFASSERPFYRRADAINAMEPEYRGATHLDNQFRLLREDFLGELRHNFQVAVGQRKGKRRFRLKGLSFAGLDCGSVSRRKLCALKLQCDDDIPQISHLDDKASRQAFLCSNKNVIKHQSLGCLISAGTVLAFATLERDEDLLAQQPPTIVIRINDEANFAKILCVSKASMELEFVQVDTAAFAYEPILEGLQNMIDLPLQEQMLNLSPEASQDVSVIASASLVEEVRTHGTSDLQPFLQTRKRVRLDSAQVNSLVAGLTKKVSLIQSPPGKCASNAPSQQSTET